jgi:ketosteroid isomerase-like protein
MAHPNEELVRRGYDAFSTGDMDTLRGLFASDIVWHPSTQGPLSGDKHGVEEVLQFFGQTMALSEGSFRVEVHDVVAGDDHAVGLQIGRATRGERRLEDHGVLVFHIRAGKVTEVWQYLEDQSAVAQFWS